MFENLPLRVQSRHLLKWVVKNERWVQTRVIFCIHPTTNIDLVATSLIMEQPGLFIKIPSQLGRSRQKEVPYPCHLLVHLMLQKWFSF